jgi:hypothetical protein
MTVMLIMMNDDGDNDEDNGDCDEEMRGGR